MIEAERSLQIVEQWQKDLTEYWQKTFKNQPWLAKMENGSTDGGRDDYSTFVVVVCRASYLFGLEEERGDIITIMLLKL